MLDSLCDSLPACWHRQLADELGKPYFARLLEFLRTEFSTQLIFPPPECVFAAFRATPFDRVKVVLLGQDPYHDEGQAHGLCFSVPPGVRIPPSLRNMLKELQADLATAPAAHGCLEHWANQGVLLLNTVLTVRAHQPNSHRDCGWEPFTDAVIRAVNAKQEPVVFVLWGNPAKRKKSLIDLSKHAIIENAHPSPLSAHRGFFGSRPFSAINSQLVRAGHRPIDWLVP